MAAHGCRKAARRPRPPRAKGASHRYRVLEGRRGVKENYDQMAGDYDSCSSCLYPIRKTEKAEERIIRDWVGGLPTPLLDVGCGTGRYALTKATEAPHVVALDISEGMLKRAIEKAKRRGCRDNLHPMLADGERLPF
ncbi:TPA: class I SAM-dependent methyltransferase, partial [Candidatus Bathyarchaeota archaeon]|nr:class I SAM-dependent methyltransferase [Candidatus Bathyarchaeota archaeon]